MDMEVSRGDTVPILEQPTQRTGVFKSHLRDVGLGCQGAQRGSSQGYSSLGIQPHPSKATEEAAGRKQASGSHSWVLLRSSETFLMPGCMPVQLNQNLGGGTQASVLSRRLFGGSILQPGLGALIYISHPTGQSLLSEFQNRPTCARHEVGRGGRGLGG